MISSSSRYAFEPRRLRISIRRSSSHRPQQDNREIVGQPSISRTGLRLVQVGGVLNNDEMVFTLAWSRETPRDIIGPISTC